MNLKELIVKFKEQLLILKDKTSIEVEKLNTRSKLVAQIRELIGSRTKDLHEILIGLSSEELLEYANFANVSYTLEDINKFKYILSEDIFKGTYRYKEAKDSLDALGNTLRLESLKRFPTEHLDDYSARIILIDQILCNIKDNKIIGSVENIVDLMEIFEYSPLNIFTDEEKETIIKQFVLSDLKHLQKVSEDLENRNIKRQEAMINESDEVVIVDEDLAAVKDEELMPSKEIEDLDFALLTKGDEPVKVDSGLEVAPTVEKELDFVPEKKKEVVTKVLKYRSAISLDKTNLLNSIGFYADKIIEKYTPRTATHEEHFHQLAEKLAGGEVDLEILRSILTVDKQFAYVLAVYIRNKVVSLNDFLDTEENEDVVTINEIFDEQMTPIKDVYDLLKKMIEKIDLSYQNTETVVQSENEEDNKFKIVFVKNGIESYFSKSLFELRAYENVGNIEKILVELENGIFGGDHKIGDFKYKSKGSFVIFYKVKNGHIFIFNVMLARDLSSKKTDNLLSLIDYTDELNAILEKGPEYRQLMEDSTKEREELRVMLGVAMNEPQL